MENNNCDCDCSSAVLCVQLNFRLVRPTTIAAASGGARPGYTEMHVDNRRLTVAVAEKLYQLLVNMFLY